jgi:periplasmic glucans biosynthesis protein
VAPFLLRHAPTGSFVGGHGWRSSHWLLSRNGAPVLSNDPKQRLRFSRREVVGTAATAILAASFPRAALAQDEEVTAAIAAIGADGDFTRASVVELARELAGSEYVPPPTDLPDAIKDLTYEQYRDIRFDREAAIWDNGLPFRLELFHRGFYYKEEIDVAIVIGETAEHLPYSSELFDIGDRVPQPITDEDIGFAGIRLLGHLNSPEKFDEIAVFLGASYFRSLGRGEVYGLSARGLSLKTGSSEGEEFPLFRAFWVEKPLPDSEAVVVHALLDSVSVAGAYRFTIRPGEATRMDVEATLFPRVDLDKVGLAPGTSMFFFGPNGREDVDDYRPEVHDSDGLLIVNGRGERIWRPLSNPKTLQISAFADAAPHGFGLMQRNRDPEAYQDFEAHYERRPGLWVEPIGDWGQGAVVLVEIPSDSEINDNIVAYWQPKQPVSAESEFSFAYRMFWGGEPALPGPAAVIGATLRGRATLRGDSPVRRFVIDYELRETEGDPPSNPEAKVSASAGTVSEVTLQPNPLTAGWRLTFKLDPEDAESIELRADLMLDEKFAAEHWLYRWTA